MPDPTLDEMLSHLASQPLWNDCDSDDLMVAIYEFASAHYAGEHSNLYAAMCRIDLGGDYECTELHDLIIRSLEEKFGG